MQLNSLLHPPFWDALKKNVLDTLFPLYCLGCEQKGFWICPPCLSHIPRRLKQACPTCLKHLTPAGQVCFDCFDSTSASLDGIFVASYFKYPLLKHAIHSYKYRFLSDLSYTLGTLLADELRKSALPLPDIILPIPLHKRRLRFRGFNQSELLADILGETLSPGLDIPVIKDVLLRARYTKPQMKTYSREERLQNLRHAFILASGTEDFVRNKNIWLIDDVATTGTTLEECATLLKKHGTKSVFGIVLAR